MHGFGYNSFKASIVIFHNAYHYYIMLYDLKGVCRVSYFMTERKKLIELTLLQNTRRTRVNESRSKFESVYRSS